MFCRIVLAHWYIIACRGYRVQFYVILEPQLRSWSWPCSWGSPCQLSLHTKLRTQSPREIRYDKQWQRQANPDLSWSKVRKAVWASACPCRLEEEGRPARPLARKRKLSADEPPVKNRKLGAEQLPASPDKWRFPFRLGKERRTTTIEVVSLNFARSTLASKITDKLLEDVWSAALMQYSSCTCSCVRLDAVST